MKLKLHSVKLVTHSVMIAVAVCLFTPQAQAVSLRDAVRNTVLNNPEIHSVSAARRASDYRLNQARGSLLPQIDLTADIGRQRVDKASLDPQENRKWRTRKQASLTIRQILFDGWSRANDIYKNAARVDAGALRVLERSEALGLTAVETYIDVRRLNHLLRIAQDNADHHVTILELIRIRKKGGKSSAGELDQTEERVSGAKAIVAEIRQSRLEAFARFKRIVGLDPRITGRGYAVDARAY